MADIIASYIVDSARVVEDLSGLRFTESYLIRNVLGRKAQLDAMQATGLPPFGDPLSGYNNMFVISRTPRPFQGSTNQVIVDVTYGPPSFGDLNEPVISFHATTTEVQTHQDINHDLIKVTYTPLGATSTSDNIIQIGEARRRKAQGVLTLSIQWTEDPAILTRYINALNSSTWFDGDKYTWCCIDVQVDKIWSRPGYRIVMSFLYDPETHLEVIFFALNGIIPSDVDPVDITSTSGNGWQIPPMNHLLDFNTLPLPTYFP